MHLVRSLALIGLVSAAAFATSVQAQAPAAGAWPVRPVTVIVNVPAGTSVDVVARGVSDRLAKTFGQPFIVDNRAGAAGNIGSEVVVHAAADGYTMLFSPASAITVNPFIYSKMKFDPLVDLIPVAAAANVVSLLVVRTGLPFKTTADLVAYAKANPGKLTYGTPGAGSVPHLAGEDFNAQAGISTVHIPYRGGMFALQDVVAGQVDYVFDSGLAMSQIRAGRLTLLGAAMPARSPQFPDAPTLNESGFRNFDWSTTFGFFAPKGTPAAIVDRMNAEVNKVLALPEVRDQFATFGADATPMTPRQFGDQLKATAKVSSEIVKERQIKVD